MLIGDRLDNGLYGGGGNDTLQGWTGADELGGGEGADRFVFRRTSDSTVDASGRDLSIDFDAGVGDLIDLVFIDANGAVRGNGVFGFIGARAFTGEGGEVRYRQIGDDTFVFGDVDGDKAADFAIRLDGLHALTAGDFVL